MSVFGCRKKYVLIGYLLAATLPSFGRADGLSMEQAIVQALQQDPWLQASQFRQQAMVAEGVAAGRLPDPVVSLGVLNVPSDTFDTGQEAMTQMKVGVTQTFPRGHSRQLQQQQLNQLGQRQVWLRRDREAQVALSVGLLWLEAYQQYQTITLIERDRRLFEHLVDVAQSSYTSATGRTRQQDLIRAQLELTQLDDRQSKLYQQQAEASATLQQWLGRDMTTTPFIPLSSAEPEIHLLAPQIHVTGEQAMADLGGVLQRHPAVVSIDQQLAAGRLDVELAQQAYRPQWSVNASYAYRDDDPMGNDRSDLMSVGVSFDLPLFTSQRQDKSVQAAQARLEALRADRLLLLRRLQAETAQTQQRLTFLDQRFQLYQQRLLRELHDQAEAALSSYTHDDGDFAEVVRARIAELNARMEFVAVRVERLKSRLQLNYLLAGAESANWTEE